MNANSFGFYLFERDKMTKLHHKQTFDYFSRCQGLAVLQTIKWVLVVPTLSAPWLSILFRFSGFTLLTLHAVLANVRLTLLSFAI